MNEIVAIVNFYFKKGDRQVSSNYRPIYVLPILIKIFKKIIYLRLSKFFIENLVITHLQFGFTKNVATLDAMMNLIELIYGSLNKKETSI